jgi:1,4-dihydroxy-2-naphthoate octaprenyltransferase
MTLTSALIGGLLAAAHGPVAWGGLAACTLGLLVAHAANNMINDYFDLAGGVDSADYPRAQYAPHPILSGLMSKEGLRNAILAANALDLGILAYLASLRGWPVMAFALAGLFISVFYVAPPLKLKHHGLGELGVFLVWGPLMIGGTYLVSAGEVTAQALLASLPYAFIVMTVLIGKHVDKYEVDAARGIRTLPVILGPDASLALNRALMIGFYALVAGLVLLRATGPWTLLVFLSIPRLLRVLKTYNQPRPEKPPPNYPLWPLWYVSWAFYLTKLTGSLFVLGLLLDWLFPIF